MIVAKRQLEANVYLPQVIDDLRAGLRRYAIKNELTPTTKKIFDESIDRKYQYSITGMGIAMVFGTMLGGGH